MQLLFHSLKLIVTIIFLHKCRSMELIMLKNTFQFICVAIAVTSSGNSLSQPLKLENVGTEHVYFSYHGKPLLSFGSMSDFVFYAAEDAFNYKKWAD